MNRRDILTLMAGAAIAPALPATRAARAQQVAKILRIGIIDDAPMWQAFRQALRDLGYIEGKSINYEYRYSEGVPDRLPDILNELIRRPVDLVATFGTPATEAAKAATATIPIVMVGVGDPVRAGLVASLARPGGNITGNTVLSPDLGAKRLQLLREAIPDVTRAAFLVNPNNASHGPTLVELKAAAATAGMTLIAAVVGSAGDIDGAFATMQRERTQALLVSNDTLHQIHIERIIALLAQHRLPAMFQAKENVAAGGLIAYGASVPDLFRRAAGYVHRILQGAKPADLPVELPIKFDLAINLKTARALGLDMPPLLIARADDVVE